jgi:cytochrome P450
MSQPAAVHDVSATSAATIDLGAVDLTDPGWFEQGPPHALFARMRAEAPVHHNVSGHLGIPNFWSVTRAAEIEYISKHPSLFSSYNHGIMMEENQIAPLDLMRNLVIFKDHPEHTRYRKLINMAFAPRIIAHLDEVVRTRVGAVLDAAADTGTLDVVQDLALPIPLAVIMDLLGAPAEDAALFADWTARIEHGARDPRDTQGFEAFMDMGVYLMEMMPNQVGTDSLIGLLTGSELDGDRLDEEELLMFFAILVFAGNDTTRNATSGGILALTERPDQMAVLRKAPELVPNAVEEILRWTTPLNFFSRTAITDVEIGGVTVPKDDRLVLWYASGSRDEALLPGADRFDVQRPVEFHHAFGGGGRHFCLGASLARLELRVIFEEVSRRVLDPQLAAPPVRESSTWVNGWKSIPLAFTPA